MSLSFKRSGYCVLGQVMVILALNLPTDFHICYPSTHTDANPLTHIYSPVHPRVGISICYFYMLFLYAISICYFYMLFLYAISTCYFYMLFLYAISICYFYMLFLYAISICYFYMLFHKTRSKHRYTLQVFVSCGYLPLRGKSGTLQVLPTCRFTATVDLRDVFVHVVP